MSEPLIALTGILQFAVNYSLVFWSEQHISSGLAAVLQAMIPQPDCGRLPGK